jgi:CBS-domain-containing membrane protein
MRVRDVMTSAVVSCGPDTTFQQLVGLMLDHGVSGIPVVDAAGRPIGIATEADLVSKQAYGGRRRLLDVATHVTGPAENTWAVKARGMTAAELMSAPVRTVGLDDLVRLAAARMVSTGVKRLPVVDDAGRVVGIVSRSDVLRLFHRPDRLVSIDVDCTLRDPLCVPGDDGVVAAVEDGIVTLTGRVSAPDHRRLIEDALRDVPGVIDVRWDEFTVDATGESALA